MKNRKFRLFAFAAAFSFFAASAQSLPQPKVLDSGWKLQYADKVALTGDRIASAGFRDTGWLPAVVPGTALTTLVHDGIYPEPLYGENNRPDRIPETLARTSWWYRNQFVVPAAYRGRRVWLNFDGINFAAEVWVDGHHVGSMRGAFKRGQFDVTDAVTAGRPATLAVMVSPQPHPGTPIEHTVANGMGKNGGITAIDGPTFLATIGWDWIPGIRDRDTGIWQKVFLSASGPVLVQDPLVTTAIPLPRTDSADVTVSTTLRNLTGAPRTGVLQGRFEGVQFSRRVTVPPHGTLPVRFTAQDTPALHVRNPKLWWPNGYGGHPLYHLHLLFAAQGSRPSSEQVVPFGIRTISYTRPGAEDLTISVNGVKVFIRGGDWGMDEAMKRIPRARLEAQIRMHQLANVNMIRNWVGQSTSEDFYELCDKYGILLWDEFFQPNPSDGPNPDDLDTYLANVRDKILRFRNHPSIAVWCARNEGYPPKDIDDQLRLLMAELEPVRLYQPSSTAGHGVNSGGPYHWREPREFYKITEAFKTETGSVSVPTLESLHGMMPASDWESVNDDWAEHDLAKGAQQGNLYPGVLAARYGAIANLADFVRKGQLANYEAFRAMYEGRNAGMFQQTTGVITWMSNPAQPSFVWQLYHYDLDPNSSLYAVQSAGEPVHIQWNEANDHLEVINNVGAPLSGATAKVSFYDVNAKKLAGKSFPVDTQESSVLDLGPLPAPEMPSGVVFLFAELHDANGHLLSRNVYWHGTAAAPDDLIGLDQLAPAVLDTALVRTDQPAEAQITVRLSNSGPSIALMAHVQLRDAATNQRILPAYANANYVTLLPGESREITISVDKALLGTRRPLVTLDGWNVTAHASSGSAGDVRTNEEALVSHWPVTHLGMAPTPQPSRAPAPQPAPEPASTPTEPPQP